jgi:AcrR family transcriptional regulator
MSKEAAKREIKQERAVRTRVEILEAAIKLFARRGILATTMSELAKAIRMTPGALYWHFPTKEDLLLASIEELHRRYYEEFKDVVAEYRKLPAREQLTLFLRRSHEFLRYHREYGIFFGMVAAESAEANDRVAEALREKMGLYVMVGAAIIRYGQTKTKEFREDLDPVVAAHGLISGFMGVMVHQHLFRETLPYDPVMETMDRLMVDAFARR